MTIPWQDNKSTIVEGQETCIKDCAKEKFQSCTKPPRTPVGHEQQSHKITPSEKEKPETCKTHRTPIEEGQKHSTQIDTPSEKEIPKTSTNAIRLSAIETQETDIYTLSEEGRSQTDTQIPLLDINLTRDQSEFLPPNVEYRERVLSNDSEFHFLSTKFKVVCVIFSTLSYHFHLIHSCCFHLFIKGLVKTPEIFKDRCSLKDIFSEFGKGKSKQKNVSLCSRRSPFYIDLHPFPFRSKNNFFQQKKDHAKKQNLFVIFCPPYLKTSFAFIYVLEQKHCCEPRQDIRSVGKHRRHLNHSSFLGSGKSALEIHTVCGLGNIELKVMDDELASQIRQINIKDSTAEPQEPLYNSELLRLESFKDWPGQVFCIRLSQAGFFYCGEGEKVECYFCQIQRDKWVAFENPKAVHEKANPSCPFVVDPQSTNNIPIYSFLLEEPLRPCFEKIKSLLVPQRIERDKRGSRSISNRSSTSSSEDSLGANSLGMSGERNTTDLSGQQPPQRFSLGLSGPRPATITLPANVSRAVQSAQASSNALPPQPQPLPMENDPGHLRYERNRLETFKNWPSGGHVLPKDLASSGFVYTGSGDRVQCVFCRGILRDWDPGDKPHIEHKKNFPRCPFVLNVNVGNVKMTPAQPAQRPNLTGGLMTQPLNNMEALGINTDRPKHSTFAVESTRISSFNNWPTYKHQTPEQLAGAGFFYAGFGDNVKCFYCDGGLRNWEPGDEPWVEHARWFPRCSFVRTVKGDQYIKTIQERFNGPQQTASSSGHRIEPREIRARMELPLVRTVLETGVDRNTVMQVIERRLRETGDDYPNAESLLNAVLTAEENPEMLNVSSHDIPPENTPSPTSPAAVTPEIRTPQNEAKPSTSTEHGNSGSTDLAEENRVLKEQKTCKICLDNEVGVVFLPCGHLCCCVTCAPAVRQCPICRAEIKGTVRTYIP